MLGLRCRHLQFRKCEKLLELPAWHVQLVARVLVHELFTGLLRGIRGKLDLYGMRGGKGRNGSGLDVVQCMRSGKGAARLRSECMRGLR